MRHTYPFPYHTYSRLDMAAGSVWKTITRDDQTFSQGPRWQGTFSSAASGDSTAMTIELDWTLPVPATQPDRVAYSVYDTGFSFAPSAKTRIFAVLLEFTDISQLTIANSLQKLICGPYVAEVALGSRVATTCGAYSGIEITGGAVPVDGNFLTYSPESVTAANLISSSTDGPTIQNMYLVLTILPNGEIVYNYYQYQFDNSGNVTWSGLVKNKSSGFQSPSGGATIKIGAWFGTGKTAQQVGDNYTFNYRLKYAYAELS